MRLLVLLCLLTASFGCSSTESTVDAEAAAYEAALEAEGEARAEAVASRLIGQPGPDVTLTTIDGVRIDLAELYGKKPVYLKFWATWCVPCRKQMPEFERIHETLGDRLEVIAVNTGYADDESAVRAYLEEIDLKMPIAVDDGTLADLLDLRVTPQHVLIGLDGRIAYISHLDGEPLDEALSAALEDSAGPVAEPKAPRSQRVLHPGDVAEGISIAMLDGETVTLGAAVGRPRGLMFFSPWCESYLAESRPQVSEDCKRAREAVESRVANGDREWIAVSDRLWATEEDLEQYRKDTGTEIPLVLDTTGELFRTFGIRRIPTIALIDGDGRITEIIGPDRLDQASPTLN